MNNPIFLTDTELLKALTLMQQNVQKLERLMSNSGLARQELSIVQAVFAHPFSRAQDVAYLVKISKQSMSRHLKKMIKDGYIIEHSDKSDKRAKRLTLSTKGVETYKVQQKFVLNAFKNAYQNAGISAVEGFNLVQKALSKSLD